MMCIIKNELISVQKHSMFRANTRKKSAQYPPSFLAGTSNRCNTQLLSLTVLFCTPVVASSFANWKRMGLCTWVRIHRGMVHLTYVPYKNALGNSRRAFLVVLSATAGMGTFFKLAIHSHETVIFLGSFTPFFTGARAGESVSSNKDSNGTAFTSF